MKYIKQKDKIIIQDTQDFDIVQILDCGQIFRYSITDNQATVLSKDKCAKVVTYLDRVEILTDNTDYFENFFDLKTDYTAIKNQLQADTFLSPAIQYGKGIRILNNDTFEMLVSFIISANNNIKRIKNSLNLICQKFGDNKGDFYAFPTLNQLKNATVQDYITFGLGYRATQMYQTIQNLTQQDIQNLQTMDESSQFNFLLSLKGVGEKVANCIMLFGLGVKNRFPVDTWINKVYNDLTNTQESDRKKITKILTDRYKDLSGYAQQYFFYYYRENKKTTQ